MADNPPKPGSSAAFRRYVSGERSSEKAVPEPLPPATSPPSLWEHLHLPKTPAEGAAALAWTVLVLAFGSLFVESLGELLPSPAWRAAFGLVGMVGVTTMLIYRTWLIERFRTLSGWAALIAIAALLIIISLSPYAQQGQWPKIPFFARSEMPLADALKNLPPDAAKLTTERDKAVKDRDAAIRELEETQHELGAARDNLTAARDAAAGRAPGSLPLDYGEVGAAVFLYRNPLGGKPTFEVIAKSTNIKTIELRGYQMPTDATVACSLNCMIVTIIFDGAYGPFNVTTKDSDAYFATSLPTARVTRNGAVHLEIAVDLGMEVGVIGSSSLHELKISLEKQS